MTAASSGLELTAVPDGIYRGRVEGVDTGPCTARIEVRHVPGGCLAVDYEALSDAHGLQHVEHALVSYDAMHVAFGEAPGVTVFHRIESDVYESGRPRVMRIVAGWDGVELVWAWHWSAGGAPPVERSRAVCRRAAP